MNPKMKDEYGVDPLLRSLGLPEDGEHINPNGEAPSRWGIRSA